MRIDIRKLDMLIAKKCLTLEELSLLSNLSKASITKLRNGERQARLSTIGKIAKALGVDVTEILED